MSDNIIHSHLEREPRPQLSPFFAARVTAHTSPRRRSVMRGYWLLSLLALIVIFRLAGLPEPAARILLALLTPASVFILLLDPAKLRRLAQIFFASP
mgnify:CR=1 FL=1